MEPLSQLLKKKNVVFLARRIQFMESTRVDQKQEKLKKKYKPVNSRPAVELTQDSTPSSTSSQPSTSVATEDRNGFRLPAMVLFNKDRVQMSWPRPRHI
ncbi:hypothetical protein BGZ65_006640, partial [Modicella reniformis]